MKFTITKQRLTMTMFKKYENIIFYKGRNLRHPLTFGDKMFIIWDKIRCFLTRWQIVDTKKYELVSIERRAKRRVFELSEEETKASEKLYKEKGTLRFIFTPTGIGNIVEVEALKTGEKINISSYNW